MESKQQIINNCINGKCSRCGQCCTEFIPLTKKELRDLKDYQKEHNIELTDWKSYNPVTNKYDLGAFCPFLDKDTNLCKVYDARPKICRTFKCCKNQNIIYKERDAYARAADFNNLVKNQQGLRNLYSLYELITGDKRRTIELLLYMYLDDFSSAKKLDYDSIAMLLRMINREDITMDDIEEVLIKNV